MSEQKQKLDITTIDGSPDLSEVDATDHVMVKRPDSDRAIIFPAGQVLTSEKKPLSEAEDGATERLDGNIAIKIGNEIIAIVENN